MIKQSVGGSVITKWGAFLGGLKDGFSGAGLFIRLKMPGAPTELVDSRGVEAIYRTGEFEQTLRRHGIEIPVKRADAETGRPVAAE